MSFLPCPLVLGPKDSILGYGVKRVFHDDDTSFTPKTITRNCYYIVRLYTRYQGKGESPTEFI